MVYGKTCFKVDRESTVEGESNIKLAYLKRNDMTVEVVASKEKQPISNPIEHLRNIGKTYLVIVVDNLDRAIADLDRGGVEAKLPPTSFPEIGIRLAIIEDNNGYSIELIQPIPKDNN